MHSPEDMLFGFPLKKKALFFRQLATMVDAGLPVASATDTAGRQTAPKVTRGLAKLMSQGHPLSEAMQSFPYFFDDYEINMVLSGEQSGDLDGQLNELAASIEWTYNLHQKLKSRLAYPVLVMHAAVFIPPLFLLVTQGLKAYVTIVLSLLIPAYGLAGGLWLAYRLCSMGSAFRYTLDSFLANFPILGAPFRTAAKMRFLDALAKMNHSGMLPDKAIPLAANACGNRSVGDAILRANKRLGVGHSISENLAASKVFKPIEVSMVSTGEESGNTAQLIAKAAEHLRLEYESETHKLMTVFPIFLLMGVGAVVGTICIYMMGNIIAPLTNI